MRANKLKIDSIKFNCLVQEALDLFPNQIKKQAKWIEQREKKCFL